ncbi:hypothetical protein BBJ28_00015330 [Nothophytophthora sp. Chile5]|nr:hypothetical protein BBJ28_00015330 [Nothophytophthora sp. Chile5]
MDTEQDETPQQLSDDGAGDDEEETRYHEVTVAKPFGCFHLMQLIEKSIQVGALFSPKLFVPKEIWQQDRVKLAGVPLKIEVFHQLKQSLEKTSESGEAPSPSGGGYGIGKLTNLAFGFGRMVKKQAIAAVERVGAAQAFAVSLDELDEYAAVLCMFFNSTRSIEHLLGLRTDADGTQEQVTEHKVVSEDLQLDPSTLKKLEELAVFLDEVVIELVMRDVHSLLEAYLQRLTRQFGEFTVEQAVLKRHSSVSA